MIYENINSKKKVFVSELFAAGVCEDTIGMSLVIYKHNPDDAYSLAMTNQNFHEKYVKSLINDDEKKL